MRLRRTGKHLLGYIAALKAWMSGKQDVAQQLALRAMAFEGQITLFEAQKLIKWASSIEAGRAIVDIGTYRGRSAIALALGSRLGARNRVCTVDPHLEFQGMLGGKFGPADQVALYRNLIKAGVGDLVAVISLRSTDVARAWSRPNVGLLFLDGDHRYEAVRADYDAWYPLVGRAGVIVFHDTNVPDVRSVTEEAVAAGQIVFLEQVDDLACFRKG